MYTDAHDAEAVLDEIADAAASDSGGVPREYLADFLAVLMTAVADGTVLGGAQLRAYRRVGDRAARRGVALRALLDLYLSAAWRLWPRLPAVAYARRDPQAVVRAGEVMLHAADDVVAALTEGFQLARRSLVREQESARREFVDDLLAGTGDVVDVLQRAAGFGLDLSGPHAVAVVQAQRAFSDADPMLRSLERAVSGSKGDAQTLITTKSGRLVLVFASPDAAAVDHVCGAAAAVLGAARGGSAAPGWRLGVGTAAPGADGAARSYRQALDVLVIADSLGLTEPVQRSRDHLVYRLLQRDPTALAELVEDTLGPLRSARGGAGPLVETVHAWFAAGGNAARTARELHLSVRAVTYRLHRIEQLTGRSIDDADDRLALNIAAHGARLLGWPTAVSER